MNWTNCLAASASASTGMAQEVTSPNCAGSAPSGPCRPVTIPVFVARNFGSAVHSGQLGRASLRSPASSSSRNVDQTTIAAWPAK